MYEHLAAFSGGLPNEYHLSLYSRWARGGWGMVITGNCQISSSHLSLGRDIAFPSSPSTRVVDAFKALSAAMHSSGTSNVTGVDRALAIVQLSHSGRQSPRVLGGRLGSLRGPFGPSSRRVGDDTKEGILASVAYRLMFQAPRTLSQEDITEVIQGFVRAAKLAFETGFDGIQLHAAHGCEFTFLDDLIKFKVRCRSPFAVSVSQGEPCALGSGFYSWLITAAKYPRGRVFERNTTNKTNN